MPRTRPQPRNDPQWVEARFDRIAPYYGLFEWLFLVPPNGRQRAMELLELRQGERVLVVGCGKFPELKDLCAAVGTNGAVIGIDLSARMLEYAKRKNDLPSAASLEQLDLLKMEKDDAFDAVYFPYSFTSFGTPQLALEKALKLLKPKGRCVILDAQLPPKLSGVVKPTMPILRWFMESTVLGDPDMRPIDVIEKIQQPMVVEYLKGRAYFVVLLKK